MSRIYLVVALSTIEVEYMVTTHVIKETVRMQQLCLGIRFEYKVVRIDCDSQSAILL